MIENLSKLLLRDYGYELDTYKVCHERIKKSKIIIPAFGIFLLVLALYFTTELIDFIVLGFSFFILVLVPITLRKGETYEVVVITPEYLIQQTLKTEVKAIMFDKIKKFGTDKTGVVIKGTKNSISLDPTILSDDILVIIDILEAKGKTFDKTKDYMIRPIEIVIIDNEVKIVDVEVEVSSSEIIVSENYKNYSMLTPGFINSIIPLNSVVEDAYTKDGSVYLKLSRFEVNPGHPENTSFEAQVATDCIMIFEDVEILTISKNEARGSSEETMEATIENLVSGLKKGVLSDWKYRQNEIDLQFSVGLYVLRTTFKYKEVIIGWNEIN